MLSLHAHDESIYLSTVVHRNLTNLEISLPNIFKLENVPTKRPNSVAIPTTCQPISPGLRLALKNFKKTEADRQVEESYARMMGEDATYVRPMDATDDKIGPLVSEVESIVFH